LLVPKKKSAGPSPAAREDPESIAARRKRRFFLVYCLAAIFLTAMIIHHLIRTNPRDETTGVIAQTAPISEDLLPFPEGEPVGKLLAPAEPTAVPVPGQELVDLKEVRHEVAIPVVKEIPVVEEKVELVREDHLVALETKTIRVPVKSERIEVTRKVVPATVESKAAELVADSNETVIVKPIALTTPTTTQATGSRRTTTTRPSSRYVPGSTSTRSVPSTSRYSSTRSVPTTTRRTTTTTRTIRIRIR